MAVSDEQIAFVSDLFSQLGPISTRKMFGGLGLYAEGQIFAIVFSDGSIRLKGVGDHASLLENAGWQHWVYERKDGARSSMPYWIMPDSLQDDPDAACDWARRSLAAIHAQ